MKMFWNANFYFYEKKCEAVSEKIQISLNLRSFLGKYKGVLKKKFDDISIIKS